MLYAECKGACPKQKSFAATLGLDLGRFRCWKCQGKINQFNSETLNAAFAARSAGTVWAGILERGGDGGEAAHDLRDWVSYACLLRAAAENLQ